MKKIFILCLVIMLMMSLSFSGCSKNKAKADTPQTVKEEVPQNTIQDNINEKIIGTWKLISKGSVAVTTDERIVQTYKQSGIFMNSSSLPLWDKKSKWNYSVENDSVKIKKLLSDDELCFKVALVTDNELIYECNNGCLYPEYTSEGPWKFERIQNFYYSILEGRWEGAYREVNGEIHEDSDYQIEYIQNGSFCYYKKDENGSFDLADCKNNTYFVAGNWLAAKWENNENEKFCKCWDIENCDETQLVMTAVRKNSDGTLYNEKIILNRVLDNLDK